MSRTCTKNISLPFFRNIWFISRVPSRQEGRTRRHERGTGCDGRGHISSTNDAGCGRQSRVVLIPRRWDRVALVMIRAVTEAIKPGTPRRARISRNTIAQGRPVADSIGRRNTPGTEVAMRIRKKRSTRARLGSLGRRIPFAGN